MIAMVRALSSLRGLRGAPEVPPLCRETQSLGQQMLNAPDTIIDSFKFIHTDPLLFLANWNRKSRLQYFY